MIAVLEQPVSCLTQARFERLVRAAASAPSADNNQPWAFRWHENENSVDVLHCRERAVASDVNDLFSWLSLGAAIENFSLAAAAEGLASTPIYHERPFDLVGSTECVARIDLRPGGTRDELVEWIPLRCTNRKLYEAAALPDDALLRIAAEISDPYTKLYWLTSSAALGQLAKLIAATDRVRFEFRPFHEELHAMLRYSRGEAERTRDGLDVRTLELPFLGGTILRWLKPWPRMQRANRLGASRLFAGASAKQVISSSAIGVLTTSLPGDEGYLNAGRMFQRVWLAATRENLAFQPLGALPLFLARLAKGAPDCFLPHHRRAMERVRSEFRTLIPQLGAEMPVMLFRTGRAPAPAACSLRYSTRQIIAAE